MEWSSITGRMRVPTKRKTASGEPVETTIAVRGYALTTESGNNIGIFYRWNPSTYQKEIEWVSVITFPSITIAEKREPSPYRMSRAEAHYIFQTSRRESQYHFENERFAGMTITFSNSSSNLLLSRLERTLRQDTLGGLSGLAGFQKNYASEIELLQKADPQLYGSLKSSLQKCSGDAEAAYALVDPVYDRIAAAMQKGNRKLERRLSDMLVKFLCRPLKDCGDLESVIAGLNKKQKRKKKETDIRDDNYDRAADGEVIATPMPMGDIPPYD